MTTGIPLETLIRVEAGLRAELDVLRTSAESDLIEDANETEGMFTLDEAQLDEHKRTKQVLEEELAKVKFQNQTKLRTVRELGAELEARELGAKQEARESGQKDAEYDDESEEETKKGLYLLRRRALAFAKEQWPLTQDVEQFEGGDFWDACIAACSDPNMVIEYSQRESAFAELLLQTGIADRTEQSGGLKRIRFAKEIYFHSE
jgi:hypothetical protein